MNDHGFNKQPSKYGNYDNKRLDCYKDEAVKQVDQAYQAGVNDEAERLKAKHDRLNAAKDAVVEAAKAVCGRLEIEAVPLELVDEHGNVECDVGEILGDALDRLEAVCDE